MASISDVALFSERLQTNKESGARPFRRSDRQFEIFDFACHGRGHCSLQTLILSTLTKSGKVAAQNGFTAAYPGLTDSLRGVQLVFERFAREIVFDAIKIFSHFSKNT